MRSMTHKQDLTYDGLMWVFLICFLVLISLSMLIRDRQKQYGTLTFGGFPAFKALDSSGKVFDEHRLHGQLSVVIISGDSISGEIMEYLRKLSQMTAMGKKYLNVLILDVQNDRSSDQAIQYLKLEGKDFESLHKWRQTLFKNGIILVDQNGVIRGIFDLDEKLERLNFEGAVNGIL